MEVLAGVTPPGHTPLWGMESPGWEVTSCRVCHFSYPENANGVKIKMNTMVMLSWQCDRLSAWTAIYIQNGAAHHLC